MEKAAVYSKDEWVRDLWLLGVSPGLTNLQRLMNLAVLSRFIGPEEIFSRTIEDLQEVASKTPGGLMAEKLLRRLEGPKK